MTKNSIPNGWVETTLGEVCESVFSGGTPKTKEVSYWNGKYPWLSSGETGQKNIYITKKTITQAGIDKSSTRLARKGQVVMATAGQGNTRGQVSFLHLDTYINQSIICLSGKKHLLDNRWFFNNLSNRYSELRALSESNSVRGSITTSMLKSHFYLLLPPLLEQEAIADILTSFDDKIELLQAQNKTLETTAQTIFKEWFGKYKIGDDLPEGWREDELGFVAILSAGGDRPKNTTKEKTANNNIPIYSNGITNDGLYGFTDIPQISEESVTVSARGTIGFVCLRFKPYVPIVRLISIIPIQTYSSSKYLFFWLKNQKISGFGTTQQQLTIPVFKKTKIIIPTSTLMNKYTQKVDSFYNKIQNNNYQIKTLTKTRDTLLPKLMSGELRVNEFKEDSL